MDDVSRLVAVLQKLVEQGNTVVVIEHNLDVIGSADWIIDLGPEGGEGGGHVVAAGTPEQVAQVAASHTGRFLRGTLALQGRAGYERQRERQRHRPQRRAPAHRARRPHHPGRGARAGLRRGARRAGALRRAGEEPRARAHLPAHAALHLETPRPRA